MAKISKSSVDHSKFELSEAMMSLSSTIICRIGFGKRYEEGGTERSRFHGLLNESQALFATFCVSDLFPSLGWIGKISGFHNRLEKISKNLMTSTRNSLMNILIQTGQNPSGRT